MDAYTIVFFQLGQPPSHLVLLHRFPHKKFGGRWTGVGGKIEPGETPLEGALREVEEETGIVGRELIECCRAIINQQLVLHYFTGPDNGLPLPISPDGVLYRVPVGEVFNRDLLYGTYQVLRELQHRRWDFSETFSIIGERDDLENPDCQLRYLRLEAGLVDVETLMR